MNLYVLRHASAGVRRKHPHTDRKRGLDKEGKQQCMLVGRYLSALDIHFDAVISSPLKRALQTASLVATETGFDGRVQVDESLAPEGTYPSFQELLHSNAGVEDLLVVGHNPNLSLFLGSLICAPHRASIRLRKGSLARVDYTRRPPQLLWLIDPRTLRQVYASVAKRSRRKTSRK